MAEEVFMPKLGMTMEVGTIVQWFKEEGEAVEVGEPLLEVLTDKINIEVEAYVSGILLKRYYGNNEVVPVNKVIGYIGVASEAVPDAPPAEGGGRQENAAPEAGGNSPEPVQEQPDSPAGAVRATPAARKAARESGVKLADVAGTGPNGRIQRDDVLKAQTQAQEAPDKQSSGPWATPLARKVAAAEQIDLGSIQGTGAHGKIVRADLHRAQSPAPEKQKIEGVRKIIGQRMAQSAFTAPHVTLHSEADMSESVRLRTRLLPPIESATGYRLSYMEIIIAATAAALRKHPDINVSLEGEYIRFHPEVHIGMAVARKDGLIVPVIRNADKKKLTELVTECKTLAGLARENKLAPEQISGGTFTISNLGMYAVDAFTPIINQPESAILGVGRIVEKAVGVNGSIELRPMMTLSLSFDHRVIDGAPAAAFLTSLKNLLENPYELLL